MSTFFCLLLNLMLLIPPLSPVLTPPLSPVLTHELDSGIELDSINKKEEHSTASGTDSAPEKIEKPRTPKQVENDRIWELSESLALHVLGNLPEQKAKRTAKVTHYRNSGKGIAKAFPELTSEQFTDFLVDYRVKNPDLGPLRKVDTIAQRLVEWQHNVIPNPVKFECDVCRDTGKISIDKFDSESNTMVVTESPCKCQAKQFGAVGI